MTYNGVVYYYETNLQGDVVGLWNADGSVYAYYDYDAWGNVIYQEGNSALLQLNPLRYRGYVYDKETGLYYLQSRYYNPELGRFISADGQISGVGGEPLGYNQFAYCFNNPVNMSDDSGNWPKWLSGALNVVSGTLQAAAGAALGATVGWTGIGAVAAAALVLNGAATVTQGIGQIVNAATNSNVMREDNIIRTGAQTLGGVIGGDVGATVGGMVYDAGIMVAATYTPSIQTPSTITPTTPVNGVCFVAGTAILTSTGLRAIEDIGAGDVVWSENPETGEKALKEVVQVFVRETYELIHVHVNGEEIITTPEHPFFVYGQGWTIAANLHSGSILVLQNGNFATIKKTQYELLKSPITVYNFEVADFHTYYVGNSAVLVHNTCKQVSSLPQNGTTMSSSDALDLAIDFLGPGYNEASRGRFVSADGLRQVRLGVGDLLGLHAGGPHINFDRLFPTYKSVHIYFFE